MSPIAGADHAFEAESLFFLDRGLDAAELHEVLRLDDSEHFDAAVGLRGATCREAQCDARFRTVVDHDEIRAFGFGPHERANAA